MKTQHTKIAARATVLCVVALQLTACGGDSAAVPEPAAGTPPAIPHPLPVNQAPTISGTPETRTDVGTLYEFRPQAADADGDTLSFRAEKQPRWLSLDAAKGTLSGTASAADIGVTRDIVISVTDGNTVVPLPPFTLEVRGAAPGPYSGTPAAIPGIIEAEQFDKGGEGAGYHDLAALNTGGQFRPNEGVDIGVSADSLGGDYVVTNFETGEWLAYTTNVGTAGTYELALRAASAFADSAYHVEIDGRDVTGRITVPNTGNWSSFQWVGATPVSLAAGRQMLKVVAD